MNKLMTVKELQDYLGIGRCKAYELVNEPDFPILRIGRSIRVPKEQLEEWIVEQVERG
ncbi:MAG TPA: helix-turn-helix domain-containing protein [Thermoanaerobacterales bacterium]|nr:helix-turn-helix domain-containing protein [Thermoanaerobacterales bacterium]